MSDIRCPNCNATLTMAELAGDWCESCGKKIPAFIRSTGPERSEASPAEAPFAKPIAPPRDFEADRPAPSRTWLNPQKLLALGILLVAGLAITGVLCYFLFRSNVDVYVDNGGKDSLTVFLDGSEQLKIGPGQIKSFSCRSGSRQIVVKRGDKIVFDETKKLESGDKSGPRKYLLNPEATNRYGTVTIEYGGLGFSLPTFVSSEDEKYWRIADKVPLAPAGAWIDVQPDLVLEKAPRTVQGKYSDSRKVLIRIPHADYNVLAGAHQKVDKITSEDMSQLETTVDRLMKLAQ